MISVYSFAYLENGNQCSEWCVIPSANVWSRRMDAPVGSSRWIATLGNEDILQLSAAMGDPVEYDSHDRLYCPQWILDALGVVGDGEEVEIEWERCENIPRATHLVLKPSQEMDADIDPRELMEGPLSMLGVARQGMVLPMPTGAGHFTVERCEPEEIVFLDGAEISVEFMEDDGAAERRAEKAAAAAIVPDAKVMAQQEESFDDMTSMLPISASSKGSGYIPFGGKGYILGGK